MAANKETNVFFPLSPNTSEHWIQRRLKTVERFALRFSSFGSTHVCVRQILALLETPPHTSHCEYVIFLYAHACQSFISFEILPRKSYVYLSNREIQLYVIISSMERLSFHSCTLDFVPSLASIFLTWLFYPSLTTGLDFCWIFFLKLHTWN